MRRVTDTVNSITEENGTHFEYLYQQSLIISKETI